MSLLVRANIVRAALVASGAVAGAGGSLAVTSVASSGAREHITIALGDTVNPRFSIQADSVLAQAGLNAVVARRCGESAIYLRVWHRTTPLAADTVTVAVPCAPADSTPADSSIVGVDTLVSICFRPDPDSVAKYAVSPDTSVSPALVPCLIPEGREDTTVVGRVLHPVAYVRHVPRYRVR